MFAVRNPRGLQTDMDTYNRYAISLIPDETYNATLILAAMGLFEKYAQGYLLTPDVQPHLPLVEFTAPTTQAAFALFNRWMHKPDLVQVKPKIIGYGRETYIKTKSDAILSNTRSLLFCQQTPELLSLSEFFTQAAHGRTYTLIPPADQDDFPALKLADLQAKEYGPVEISERVWTPLSAPQMMRPALGRCDAQGHMVHVLAPAELRRYTQPTVASAARYS